MFQLIKTQDTYITVGEEYNLTYYINYCRILLCVEVPCGAYCL